MPHAVAGLVTTLPLMAFAVFSLLAPSLARRCGMERVLLAGLLLVSAGLIMRPWSGVAVLLIGTGIGGIGTAICNVLLPAYIKREMPNRMGLMTGVYSVAMNLTGAIAAAVSIPLSVSFGWGWEWTLTLWATPAIIAAAYWTVYMKRRTRALPAAVQPLNAAAGKGSGLWRYTLSWQMTLHMGIQSFLFFVIMAWLPDIASERGIDGATAGLMVSMMQFCGLPLNFIMPILAAKVKDQRRLAAANGMLYVTALTLLFMDHALWLGIGAALIGVGSGSSFSLSIMFFNLRTHTAEQASEISGMAQSVGYLLACTGPFLFGWLHDWNGGWDVPLMLLIVFILVFIWAGLGAGRDVKLPEPQQAAARLGTPTGAKSMSNS
jgi:CP family cyanate transporter-like MFS transporter